MGVGDMIPSLVQGGAAAVQFPFEMVVEGLNQLRREQGARDVTESGAQHSQTFRENVLPWYEQSANETQTGMGNVNSSLDKAGQIVGEGADRAVGEYRGVAADATERGAKTFDDYKARADEVLTTLPGIETQADDVFNAVKQQYHDIFENAASDRNKILQLFEEGNTKIADVTTRASGAVSGMTIANKRGKQDFEAKARSMQPPLSEAEIQSQLAVMDEDTRQAVSATWNQAAVATSAEYVTHYGNGMSTLASMSNTVTGAMFNALGVLNAAGQGTVEARKYTSGARERIAGNLFEAEMGVNNYVTGAQTWAATGVAQTLMNSAQVRAALEESRATFQFNTAQKMSSIREQQAAATAQMLDLAYTAVREGVAVRLAREFTPPSMVNMLAPATQLMQSGINTRNSMPEQSHDAIWGSLIGGTAQVASAGMLSSPGGGSGGSIPQGAYGIS